MCFRIGDSFLGGGGVWQLVLLIGLPLFIIMRLSRCRPRSLVSAIVFLRFRMSLKMLDKASLKMLDKASLKIHSLRKKDLIKIELGFGKLKLDQI